YFKGPLDGWDRIKLEGLVRNAVQRFEAEEDEGRREEFRQLLKSFNRFYSFVAQVVRLEDTDLEKLHAFADWLLRLLPDREVPPEIEITDEMLRLQAFKLEEREAGSASLAPGMTEPLRPISEFGAKPYTEDEKRSLSEIIQAFNERYGAEFSEEHILHVAQEVSRDVLDEKMTEMLRNNPPDVVSTAFDEAVFRSLIAYFGRSGEMKNILLTDAEMRRVFSRNLLTWALREVNLASR